ncbi:MAG: right-handed parallel beta-helix repeat-containing protein, partial [Phycisphaerae bacterium]|nr:right-handed parallel beta-helix repeat-containing protein [Phycisphaerae bacterium]
DTDFSDNEYTTAAGDNLNGGKSPGSPMSSLRALLAAYDLDAGDTVYVDAGTYAQVGNIILTFDDAGVTIRGPEGEGHSAVLDRSNTAWGSYVFELLDADGVTLDHLDMTGGYHGVYAGEDSDSDDVTISNSRVHENDHAEIYLLSGNDDAVIVGNEVFDLSYYSYGNGIDVAGDNAMVTGNVVYDNSNGINVTGDGSTVSGNSVYGNEGGIYAYGDSARIVVSNNEVFDNSSTGIYAYRDVLVTDNTVYGHSDSWDTGIYLRYGAKALRNVVHGNYNGICAYDDGVVTENRVYNNSSVGILAYEDSDVRGNAVYSNSIGIQGERSGSYVFHGLIENNLVYANSNHGIVIEGAGTYQGSHTRLINNTVYQPVGDAVRVRQYSSCYASRDVELRNNILWVGVGYAISVDSNSQQGFVSDYNLLYTSGTGRLANWGGVEFTDRVDWFYELGLDAHSLVADPQFVDFDGSDDILGFVMAPIGSAQIIDDGETGFSLSGTWSDVSGDGGYDDDYQESTAPDGVASWTFSGLTPGSTYQLAATWRGQSGNTREAWYRVYEEGTVVSRRKVDQYYAPEDFTDGGVDWEALGYFEASGSTLEVRLSGSSIGRLIADAVRLQQIAG